MFLKKSFSKSVSKDTFYIENMFFYLKFFEFKLKVYFKIHFHNFEKFEFILKVLLKEDFLKI